MSHWTEEQVIQAIQEIFPSRKDLAPCGIGDDCAVLMPGLELITTDASVEGVHFDLSWMSLADAAYRCMTSNVSDAAAMGAYAGPFTLALGLREDIEFNEILSAIQAIKDCIQEHGLSDCWLIGGDVVRSSQVFFSITVLSQKPAWPVVLRSGAKPGDVILALGRLGMSAVGLELYRRSFDKKCSRQSAYAPYLKAFCRPHALTSLGPDIAQQQLVHAMMDISDGIRTDLPRLMKQSHCGARVDLGVVIPDGDLIQICKEINIDPIDQMICGGEDFGLLVTTPPQNVAKIKKYACTHQVPCYEIGVCTDSKNVEWFERGKSSHRIDTSFSHF